MNTRPIRKSAPLIVTSAFAAMLMAANLATPLYAVYARQFKFSTVVLALVFAVYALVLIPSLLLFGQLSDRLGRRPAIALGLGLNVLALVVFALAGGTAWLFAARGILGVAQGMISGAATAALAELAADRKRYAALLATLAQVGGISAGVLVCGVLAQWAPWPMVLPYVAGMSVCVLLGVLLWLVPETAGHRGGALHVRRPRVPAEIWGPFLRVGLTGAAVWAVAGGLFLSVMPSYAGSLVVHSRNLALLALLTSIVFLTSFVTQLLLQRATTPPARTQAVGLVLLAAGLATLVGASPTRSIVLLAVGAVLAGIGHGTAYLAAQDALTRIAPADQRAEVSAAFYVCVYLGVSLPVIGIGIVADVTTLFTAVATFAAVTGIGSLALAAWHLLRGADDGHGRERQATRDLVRGQAR